MKGSWVILLFLLCSFSAYAQKNNSIMGILVDKNTQQSIDLATVQLLNAKDSSYVTGEMSNQKGEFRLNNLAKGKYLVSVTYLGYQTIYQPADLTGNTTVLNLGKLQLSPADVMLAEAVITGKAAEIVVKNDTIEYNADSYKVQENSVVEDLLKRLPGVEVDKDGKVTVNGKEVKKFLVDGKDFFKDDPQVASKNLPAGMVDKLQVLDRKSDMARMTGFDDGNEETVINLTIKPGMKQGIMGNAMAGIGQDLEKDKDSRYEAAAMLNSMKNSDRYTLMLGANNTNNMGAADMGGQLFGGMRGMRRGSGGIVESERLVFGLNKEFSSKLSLNGDIRYSSNDRNSENKVNQETIAGEKSQRDKSASKNNDISDNVNANFRLEWKPDTSNTFIFTPSFGYNKSSSNQNQVSTRSNISSGDTISETYANSSNHGDGYNFSAKLEYSHRFSKPGRIFSASAGGTYNDSYSQGLSDWTMRNFKDDVYTGNTYRNQQSENDYKSENYQAFASYVEPLGRNNFLQLTYRITQYETRDINSTYNLSGNPESGIFLPTDTATLVADQSRSTIRTSTEQRYGIAFKAVRPKYNYTIGLNLDPTYSNNKTLQPDSSQISPIILPPSFDEQLPNNIGYNPIDTITQHVVNFSPDINFNYLFGQRTNLKVNYSGTTNQPTASQLRNYTDISDPNNLVEGNPKLKPGYSNGLNAGFNKFIPESQLFFNLDLRGSFSFNDVTANTTIRDNGVRLTTYENVNGNWNTSFRGGFNTPLKNKKITVGNFAMASYDNRNTYTNGSENTRKTISFTDRANINFRSKLFDIGINGMLQYNNISYKLQPINLEALKTLDWGAGGYTTWYLPKNFTVESDINWTARSGYAKGYNIPEVMWNAAVTKQLFNKKFGTGSLKLKIYDILKDRNSISSSSTDGGFRSIETTVIPSFFMCTFIYKFSIFPKGSSASEQDLRGDDRWRGRPGGGGRPGGNRPF